MIRLVILKVLDLPSFWFRPLTECGGVGLWKRGSGKLVGVGAVYVVADHLIMILGRFGSIRLPFFYQLQVLQAAAYALSELSQRPHIFQIVYIHIEPACHNFTPSVMKVTFILQ